MATHRLKNAAVLNGIERFSPQLAWNGLDQAEPVPTSPLSAGFCVTVAAGEKGGLCRFVRSVAPLFRLDSFGRFSQRGPKKLVPNVPEQRPRLSSNRYFVSRGG